MENIGVQGLGAAPMEGSPSMFREADFMAIMLSEITNQDPFEPAETGEMVQNVQKLQELANSNFEKFRNDIRWAQDIVGKEVTAGQGYFSENEYQGLLERGIRADRGFGVVTGTISSYRVVGERVWVTIDDKDYEIDNVQQILPQEIDSMANTNLADSMLGKTVTWLTDNFELQSGTVERVSWNDDGISLIVDGDVVPFENIRGLSL